MFNDYGNRVIHSHKHYWSLLKKKNLPSFALLSLNQFFLSIILLSVFLSFSPHHCSSLSSLSSHSVSCALLHYCLPALPTPPMCVCVCVRACVWWSVCLGISLKHTIINSKLSFSLYFTQRYRRLTGFWSQWLLWMLFWESPGFDFHSGHW